MKRILAAVSVAVVLVMLFSMTAFAADLSGITSGGTVSNESAWVEGSVTAAAGQQVTALVVEKGVSLSSVAEGDIAYIDQVTAEGGSFRISFKVDTAKFGVEYTAYIGGSDVSSYQSKDIILKARFPGDADGDGRVNITDYLMLVDTWNRIEGDARFDARADFNEDGRVNIDDYLILLDNWNRNYNLE